jgi:D-arginine dehydrogenase
MGQNGWIVTLDGGATVRADVVVNAAGAWGDVVAARAGLAPVGLQPLRRTAFMTPSRHSGSERWPLLADVDHQWYVKPDGIQFLCSPADEQPSEPCDAKPEPIDVALAIDRINEATTLDIRHVASSWAGLRSFVGDRSMVIGPDPAEPRFVWCVGQGGTGIQTSPAAGQLVADLLLGGEPGPSFAAVDLDLAALLPDRLRK